MKTVKYYRDLYIDPRRSIDYKALRDTLDENSLDYALHSFVWDIFSWKCLINHVDDIISRFVKTQNRINYGFEYIDCLHKLMKSFSYGDLPNVQKLYDKLEILEKDILKKL